MTFICSVDKHISNPGEKRTLVTVETRPKSYPVTTYIDIEGFEQQDNGGEGWEIVREEPRCPLHV